MSDLYPSVKGKILISNSSVVTDDFHKTVVFMVEHDASGAFGLVVNKRSNYLLKEVVLGLPPNAKSEAPMYFGGPVDQSFISILHNNGNLENRGLEVIPGVFMSRSFDLLLTLIEENSKFHIFHGYSGWGALQLESEFERKSWATHEANADIIFSEEPEIVWREALRSMGGIYKYFAEHTKDPMLN